MQDFCAAPPLWQLERAACGCLAEAAVAPVRDGAQLADGSEALKRRGWRGPQAHSAFASARCASLAKLRARVGRRGRAGSRFE